MYNHIEIEKKWQDFWDENKCFKTDVYDFSKPKFYALDMFPYPSGVGLHAGHPEGYTATDVICRMKRLQGFNVLHPMGYDSFGLPAEQYAIKTGNHPSKFTDENIVTFRNQLKSCGFSYDWDREISTSDPKFYKWTQWIFKRLFLDGYAKIVDMPVNWCPELGTVLSNDEVIDGKSERGGFPVVRRNMKQWVIDIPKYAERLLSGLDEIDWPEGTKEIQRNWIGKSIGASIVFKVDGSEESFEVFTTRCDTLFGATYCVLAPEHPLVCKITTNDKQDEVNSYIDKIKSKSDLERSELNKDKTGVFTGSYAINPVNGRKMPIFISDYVLMSYGCGAIMAVPAHDDRDYEFAKKFNIDIIPVLDGGDISKCAFTEDGVHINSGFLDGLNKSDAISAMIKYLEENDIGTKKVNYKLREWIFARQRYWGEPVPAIKLCDGRVIALDDSELPLELPVLDDYKGHSGLAPLDSATSWKEVIVDGAKGERETSTMPGSAGSSWYFLRYIDPHNDKEFCSKELSDHWMPVDLYVGGPEHAVGHLLYSRMWNNYLFDKGLVSHKEPFKKLVHQGMILGSNGIKMGKRFPEFCVNPSDIINEYGADTLRLYEMFMGPLSDDKAWSNDGVVGSRRFIDRVYRLYTEHEFSDSDNPNLDKVYNQTVKKITEDYEKLSINTAISQMMIFVNACYKESVLPRKYMKNFLILMNPVIPHVTEELYSHFNELSTITKETWPQFDESKLTDDSFEMVVSVNGKVRGKMVVSSNITNSEMESKAKSIPNVISYIDSKEIVKVIVVPKKMVNIVVK